MCIYITREDIIKKIFSTYLSILSILIEFLYIIDIGSIKVLSGWTNSLPSRGSQCGVCEVAANKQKLNSIGHEQVMIAM